MRCARGVCAVALIAGLACGVARAQAADPALAAAHAPTATPTIAFHFERPGEPVPKYTLTLRIDGNGSYEGEATPVPTRYGPASAQGPTPFRREMQISAGTTDRIFRLAAQLDYFNKACESKAKNIADTGAKTLTYTAAEAKGSCTYNYTDLKELQALTDTIQGIAETMDEGRELDRQHRFDRLGLDASIAFLAQEAAAGHALELETIGTSLRSIADDSAVLARVRTKASALLGQAAAGAGPSAEAR